MSEELCFLTVAEASRLIRDRKLSPVDLTRAYLARIDAINPHLDAFITVTADLALKQAHAAENEIASGQYKGPIHGVPFGLKDMFETKGIRTTACSRILEHYIPQDDAETTARLYAAGGVLIGKLTTHEFAHGGPSFDLPWPPARNPWNTGHFTGGSSSGSAAGVAAGLMPAALGTDTGGSIRSPSWLCGTVGLKPTFGRVSRVGVIPFSESCDHAGPITWSVEDAAILLDVLSGYDERDRGSAQREPPRAQARLGGGMKGLRIGFLRHFSEEDVKVNSELREATDAALRVLADLGAVVEDVRLRSLHDYYAVRVMLTESEQFSLHLKNLQQRPGDYGEHFLGRCLPACLFTASNYLSAQRERRRMLAEMQPLYDEYDALITVGAGPAPHLDDHKRIGATEWWLKPGMGALASVTGAPALALSCGFSRSGLPMGFQIVGRPWQEATVLRIGHAYEKATQWRSRRPALTPNENVEHKAPPDHGAAPVVDEAFRQVAATAAARAGLKLTDSQFTVLLEQTPSALALAARLPRDHGGADEMASAFRLF